MDHGRLPDHDLANPRLIATLNFAHSCFSSLGAEILLAVDFGMSLPEACIPVTFTFLINSRYLVSTGRASHSQRSTNESFYKHAEEPDQSGFF